MKWTDLNLSSLRYFVDAIELGSLTESANKNTVTRPAISQAIRRIESVIGYDLISHEKNALVLTDRGRVFLKQAKNALQVFEQGHQREIVRRGEGDEAGIRLDDETAVGALQ